MRPTRYEPTKIGIQEPREGIVPELTQLTEVCYTQSPIFQNCPSSLKILD
jgi:hypothetical protein